MLRIVMLTLLSFENVLGYSHQSQCHYFDPYQTNCRYDEVNITLKYPFVKPSLCTTKCVVDDDCPQSKCSSITSKPKCNLEDELGDTFCGFSCNLTKNFPCSTDEYMVCMPTSVNEGVCAYLR